MRMLLELDPNVVKPGYIPLLITVGLGLVMVLLFRSMRRHFRRVNEFYPQPTGTDDAARVEDGSTAPAGGASTATGTATPVDDERAPSR